MSDQASSVRPSCSPSHPSVFFVDEDDNPHFVVVVTARYPDEPNLEEGLIKKIREGVSGFAACGFIAKVTLVSVDGPLDQDAKGNGNYLPLLRGRGYHQKYSGLLALE